MISILESFLLILISLAAGILATVSGGGGGTFVVPAIVSTIDESPQVLVGSVFLMYFVSSVTGLVVYYKKGLVDVRSGILLALPTIPGVLIGTFLETSISSNMFKLALGVLVSILGLVMLFRPAGFNVSPIAQNSTSSGNVSQTGSGQRTIVDKMGRIFEYRPHLLIGYVINFAAGLLCGLFGAGAAVIIIPTTILFVKLPGHVAIATTRIVLFILNGAALFAHIGTGLINAYYGILLAIGAIIGSIVGARIAFRASKTSLTKFISIIFLLIGAYLIFSVS